jgi:hypothetical protein
MARGKGTPPRSDDRERLDDARDSQPKESDEKREPKPDQNREEWWRNEGGGQGEVY